MFNLPSLFRPGFRLIFGCVILETGRIGYGDRCLIRLRAAAAGFARFPEAEISVPPGAVHLVALRASKIRASEWERTLRMGPSLVPAQSAKTRVCTILRWSYY